MEQLSEVMKGVVTGDTSKVSQALEGTDFAPFAKDIDEALYEMRQSKAQERSRTSNLSFGMPRNSIARSRSISVIQEFA